MCINRIPKISIITITYNSEKTIEETIKSIITQDYDNLEYLIIDGGSTDRTLEIVNKYKDKIDIFISEQDNGISDAFNKGINHATGEIIGIINSDDLLMPNALETISNNYNPQIDVYSGNVLFWNQDTGDEYSCRPDIKFDKLKLQFGVAHPSRFIRKSAYENYGLYDINFRYMMDADLLCRFYKRGASFMHIDKDLAKFRMGGTTADSLHKKKDEFRRFVLNFGGTNNDFITLWTKKVFKYYIIKISTFIFGEGFRFVYYRIFN